MTVQKSGVCKADKCNKAQLRDGYCQQCGQYYLQKQIFDSMKLSTQLLINVANGLGEVQQSLANLGNIAQPVIKEKIIEKTIVEQAPTTIYKDRRSSNDSEERPKHITIGDDDDAFIPQINIGGELNIVETEHTSINKDINSVVAKLQKTSGGK